jgi:hypothetical protein
LRTTWPWQGDRVASGLPPVGGVVLLDFVLLNLRGEWRGTTRLSTGVSPQGAGPGRGRQADRRGRPGAWISTQSIYTWWRQDRIDRGLVPSLISAEKIELAAAKRRIAELRATRRAMELVREVVPQRGFRAVAVMATEGIPVEVACRVLDVSTSGYYAWRSRPPSARSIRHAWLTDLIVKVHRDSRSTHGAALRVPAELRLGHGLWSATTPSRC